MARTARVAKALDPYTDGSGSAPNLALANDQLIFRDVGSYGLRQYGGWVREEFLRQLQGREAARVYREMLDNSPTVGSIIFAITQSMRKIEWRVNPANDTPAAQEAADFAESLRGDMSHTWEDFIAEALSMLGYGYSPHEIVYKRRLGRKPKDGSATSRHDDGKIGIRRLPIRSQDTVIKWFFDENGQVTGLTQQPWKGPMIDLPMEKILLFRPGSHKNSPEGRSVLRSAYRPYHFLTRLEEQEAVMLERLSGLPVMSVPGALLEMAKTDPSAAAQLAAYQRLVRNVRVDDQMGIVIPSDPFPNGTGGMSNVRQYEFTLVTPQARATGVNADNSIQRYKLDILKTVLADFIDLGHQARGTQNLAISKVDMFFQAIEGWLNSMAAVLNRYLLPRVWALNGMDDDLMPEYAPDLAQRLDLDLVSNFILRLSQAGMPLFPDHDLEDWVRDAAGMPQIDESADRSDAEAAARARQGIADNNTKPDDDSGASGDISPDGTPGSGDDAGEGGGAEAVALSLIRMAARKQLRGKHVAPVRSVSTGAKPLAKTGAFFANPRPSVSFRRAA